MGQVSLRAPKASRAAFLSSFALVACVLVGASVHAANPLDSLALVYDDGMGHTLPYRLFLPPGYDQPGAEFPLVLFLHGAGERGDDNYSQVAQYIDGLIDATQSDRYASFLLAPQVPLGQSWSGGSGDQLSQSMELTTEIIAQLETEYQIDPMRRYVTGLSMGGFGTFDVIAKRPGMFAAAAPMSGGGDTSRADDIVNTPVWIFHGAKDGIVSPDYDRAMTVALQQAGGDPIYWETQGGHDIWGPIYDDPFNELYGWMFDGTAPPLATLTYNSVTGDVKLDGSLAPGGAIDVFRLYSNSGFLPTGDIVIDGVPVSRYTHQMLYSDLGAGFSSVVDLGNILQPGLDLFTLADDLFEFNYHPSAGGGTRNFRLLIVAPEPASALLLLTAMAVFLTCRRPVH